MTQPNLLWPWCLNAWCSESDDVSVRVSNGIRIFYTVNTGMNGFPPGIQVFGTVCSVYWYSWRFLFKVNIGRYTGIPV